MANDSKYQRNRNSWKRIYPPRRTKPRTVTIYEGGGTENGGTEAASIDVSRYVRARSFFELGKPILGTLATTGSGDEGGGGGEPVSGSVAVAYLPNCPSGFTYDATVSSSVTETTIVDRGTFTGVDSWAEISGGLNLISGSGQAGGPATRPKYDGYRWISFSNQYWLTLENGASQWDFLKENGGSMVALWSVTSSISDGTSGQIFASRGADLENLDRGTGATLSVASSNIQFSTIISDTNSVTQSNSPNFSGVTSGSTYVMISRWVSGSVAGVSFSDGISTRVNGDWTGVATTWTDWNSTDSNIVPRVGRDFDSFFPTGLPGKMSVFMICPDVFTDAQCAAIEQWAQTVYSVQLTSSIDGTPAPTS